ncbi:MAG: hypothetical protein WAS05_00160 [Candidatus Nanopelagicales bacterium]
MGRTKAARETEIETYSIDCDQCGQLHPRGCKAHKKSDGSPCGQYPVPGGTVCRYHGGATTKAKEAGKRNLARQKAEQAVATLGLPREVDPGTALLEEVHRTAGHVAWLEQQIRDLDPEALTWGKTSEVHKTATEFAGVDTTHEAGLPVLMELYQAERKHLVTVCSAALKAGVEQRRVELAEQQGQLIVTVIKSILGDPELGLTTEQQQAAPAVASRHLRSVQ